jgi:hypothetical protein
MHDRHPIPGERLRSKVGRAQAEFPVREQCSRSAPLDCLCEPLEENIQAVTALDIEHAGKPRYQSARTTP